MSSTNGDWIRSMSDESLAEFIMSSDIPWCGESCPWYDDKSHFCEDCIVEWLNQERET